MSSHSQATTTLSVEEADNHFSNWQAYIEEAEHGHQMPWIKERMHYNAELRAFFAPAREEYEEEENEKEE